MSRLLNIIKVNPNLLIKVISVNLELYVDMDSIGMIKLAS